MMSEFKNKKNVIDIINFRSKFHYFEKEVLTPRLAVPFSSTGVLELFPTRQFQIALQFANKNKNCPIAVLVAFIKALFDVGELNMFTF